MLLLSVSPGFITVTSIIADILNVLVILVIIRILLTWLPSFSVNRNPITRTIAAIVDPMLAPFRRMLPTMGGLDFSPIALLVVLEVISSVIGNLPYDGLSPGGVIIAILAQLATGILSVILVLILIRFLLRLFQADRFHPLVRLVEGASNPFVSPFSMMGGKSITTVQRHPIDLPAGIAFVVYMLVFLIISHFFQVFF